MSIIKKNLVLFSIFIFLALAPSKAEELKKIGKFKDWQTMVLVEPSGTVCFAQSSPVLQAPKSNKRDSKLFVTFRPNEKIVDEISASPGYEFNKKNSVTATSGKNKIKFKARKSFQNLRVHSGILIDEMKNIVTLCSPKFFLSFSVHLPSSVICT